MSNGDSLEIIFPYPWTKFYYPFIIFPFPWTLFPLPFMRFFFYDYSFVLAPLFPFKLYLGISVLLFELSLFFILEKSMPFILGNSIPFILEKSIPLLGLLTPWEFTLLIFYLSILGESLPIILEKSMPFILEKSLPFKLGLGELVWNLSKLNMEKSVFGSTLPSFPKWLTLLPTMLSSPTITLPFPLTTFPFPWTLFSFLFWWCSILFFCFVFKAVADYFTACLK